MEKNFLPLTLVPLEEAFLPVVPLYVEEDVDEDKRSKTHHHHRTVKPHSRSSKSDYSAYFVLGLLSIAGVTVTLFYLKPEIFGSKEKPVPQTNESKKPKSQKSVPKDQAKANNQKSVPKDQAKLKANNQFYCRKTEKSVSQDKKNLTSDNQCERSGSEKSLSVQSDDEAEVEEQVKIKNEKTKKGRRVTKKENPGPSSGSNKSLQPDDKTENVPKEPVEIIDPKREPFTSEDPGTFGESALPAATTEPTEEENLLPAATAPTPEPPKEENPRDLKSDVCVPVEPSFQFPFAIPEEKPSSTLKTSYLPYLLEVAKRKVDGEGMEDCYGLKKEAEKLPSYEHWASKLQECKARDPENCRFVDFGRVQAIVNGRISYGESQKAAHWGLLNVGNTKDNDRFVVSEFSMNKKSYLLAGVFDGHGPIGFQRQYIEMHDVVPNSIIPNFLQAYFPSILQWYMQSGISPEEALKQSVYLCDMVVSSYPYEIQDHPFVRFPGSCASLVLLEADQGSATFTKARSMHMGDSVILRELNSTESFEKLTEFHKFKQIRADSDMKDSGPGFLCVANVIGDLGEKFRDVKYKLTVPIYNGQMRCEPIVKEISLEDTKRLIIFSDGLSQKTVETYFKKKSGIRHLIKYREPKVSEREQDDKSLVVVDILPPKLPVKGFGIKVDVSKLGPEQDLCLKEFEKLKGVFSIKRDKNLIRFFCKNPNYKVTKGIFDMALQVDPNKGTIIIAYRVGKENAKSKVLFENNQVQNMSMVDFKTLVSLVSASLRHDEADPDQGNLNEEVRKYLTAWRNSCVGALLAA
eukprot:GHVP01012306.1.p1 GENE.GHVP01012306.1~~GHVP01012306.1.p1  ORF type:complete len:811 (-),score=165.03 GHVP01012306.1:38-2446(-)